MKPRGLMQRDEADLRWYFCEWSGECLKSSAGVQLQRLAYGQVAFDRAFRSPDDNVTEDYLETAERAREIAATLKAIGDLNARVLERIYGAGQWRQLGLIFGHLAGVVPVTKTAREFTRRYLREQQNLADQERQQRRAANGTPQPIVRTAVYVTPTSIDDFLAEMTRWVATGTLPHRALREAKKAVLTMQDEAFLMSRKAQKAYEAARQARDRQGDWKPVLGAPEARRGAPHRCRVSTVYPCECGGVDVGR